MDALTEARETNKRLNRRLGDTEHTMHSLVSHAQREANEATLRAGAAQAQSERLMKYWIATIDRSRANEELVGRLVLAVAALSLALIVESIWIITR